MPGNQLTNLNLPSDLGQLSQLDLGENLLTNFLPPPGLTNLSDLTLDGNQLTNVTLQPDETNLPFVFVNGNPLISFVVSETMAATNLAPLITNLVSRGVQVFTYQLAIQIVEPLPLVGAFKIGIKGPPGVYTVLGSEDLVTWAEVGVTTNSRGAVNFVDANTNLPPRKFYRVRN
jgi:hypothetical protein